MVNTYTPDASFFISDSSLLFIMNLGDRVSGTFWTVALGAGFGGRAPDAALARESVAGTGLSGE